MSKLRDCVYDILQRLEHVPSLFALHIAGRSSTRKEQK